MKLSELETGRSAVIVKVLGHGAFRKRIMEMGFVRGRRVAALLNAPLRDPVKYEIMDYEVSLRRSEAAMIEVVTEEEAKTLAAEEREGGKSEVRDGAGKAVRPSGRRISIALVGNPNSGKTSLFNAASGSHEHVGNYSGVTVDAKRGAFTHGGYRFTIYDLPGTYSLSAYTPEELFVRRHLVDSPPDVVVNVVAASNLERNLYLTTELIDMDCCPVVMALNMYDELEHSGAVLDHGALGEMLGIPIVPTVSRSGGGLDRLFDTIIDMYENREPRMRHVHITHPQDVEDAINAVKSGIKLDADVTKHFAPRYLAIKMIEGDREVGKLLSGQENYPQWEAVRYEQVARIERTRGEDIETIMTDSRYGFISGALRETLTPGEQEEVQTTRIIDSFVTNRFWGFPVFILFMWLMFEATFSLGQYPMDWIESGVVWLGDAVRAGMSDGMLKDLLIDGIIGGVGGVIVFLPNILILYLFISFMEDSGYMARAAFIMDKLMHRIGLHGKSFIPLIMGFGCNVPAIMATRSIESRSSRLITILINPFMSCSARLPVYILIIGAFFPAHGGLVMFCLYFLGIAVAALTAKMLRRFMFNREDTPFVMELPPYRMPTLRSTLIHMWEKAAQYLRKMGGIILVASIAVWFLSYFPRGAAEQATENADTETIALYEQQKNSYIGRVGRFISPAMDPLGFDWKANVALISGMAAKELVVSTLGVLHADADADEHSAVLMERLARPDPATDKPDMTGPSALAFLVFCLLYFPCIAALVAIARESGSWKWAFFSLGYNMAVAWAAAFVVYNTALLFS